MNVDVQQSAWRNRIVGHGDEAPGQLLANPRNWRLHPKHQQDALSGILGEVGWVQEITVNRRTGFVVDGHLRVALAVSRRERFVPVRYVDLDEDEEALVLATLDPIGAMANSDAEQLSALLEGLEPADEAVAKLLRELAPPRTKQLNPDDADLTPPEEPVTQPGDLWLLGDHRLLCGDSTNTEDVVRLMDGKKAGLMATDPPYAVDYAGGEHPASKGNRGAANRNKDWSATYREVDIADPAEFFAGFVARALVECLDTNAAIYVWHASARQPELERALRGNGVLVHQQIIWRKSRAVLTYSHFMWNHEPCLYGWLEGHQPERRPPANATSVWEVDSKIVDGTIDVHPTQKPVQLFADPMTWHLLPQEVAYEPFAGSGTALIAAEQTDRRCYALEIQPAYCDVIVRRWERVSGGQAVKADA